MSYRRTLKLICGLAAGGSTAVMLAAVAVAESRGEQKSRWSGGNFGVLQAAQPATWSSTNSTPMPSGPAWDYNWDKYVSLHPPPPPSDIYQPIVPTHVLKGPYYTTIKSVI